MAVHFNGLVQIIQSLDTFSISNEAAIGLLKGKVCDLCGFCSNQLFLLHGLVAYRSIEVCKCECQLW
jgi:hypothetical protein